MSKIVLIAFTSSFFVCKDMICYQMYVIWYMGYHRSESTIYNMKYAFFSFQLLKIGLT
jgi:hypothetical protein